MSATLPDQSRYPFDMEFSGKSLLVLCRALQYREEILKSKFGQHWPLEGYNVLLNVYEEHECAEIAFCPKVDNVVAGIPFEVPDQGVWHNGPGMTLVVSLEDYSLLKTTFMR